MTDAAHIRDDALGLASLPTDDRERVAAFAHARDCAECARALRGAESLLAKLDALPPAPGPPAPALRAISRRILGKLSALVVPTRLLSVALLAVWLTLVVLAKRRAPGGAAWGESLALVGAALACLGLLKRIGSAAIWLAFGASALVTALAWQEGPLAPRHGVACLLTELAAAAVPLAILVRTFVKNRSANPSPSLVLAAGAGALMGQAALRLTCPDGTAGFHILVFHGGGVIVAALVAMLLARVLTARLGVREGRSKNGG
jgi:hypothetical protein